ncbi:hypothetical protein pb186bvf_015334 [Paramecium bursaria]
MYQPPQDEQPLNPDIILPQIPNPIPFTQPIPIQVQFAFVPPQIPDQIRFEHHYEHRRPICSDHHKTSRINVPVIGEFIYNVVIPCMLTKSCLYCGCQMFSCDPHLYPYLIYELTSGQLRIKFFEGGYAKIFYGLKLLGEIVQAKPNFCDLFGGRSCSSFPQFHIEEEDTKRSYQLIPDSSAMPTCQYNYICLPQSVFGFFRNIRPIVVKDYNGNPHPIKISNERNLQSKCRAHCCPCIPCCDTPNYPEFDIAFDPSILQVERILTISALVMMTFYDHWAQIGFVGASQVFPSSLYRVTI